MKLSKERIATKAQLAATLRETGEDYQRAIEAANETIKATHEGLQTLRNAYTNAIDDANNFMEEIAADARDQLEARSEKFQESDKGQDRQSFIDAWESTLDTPDDLPELQWDTPELDPESFEELPDAP